jgi:hypothetical protein
LTFVTRSRLSSSQPFSIECCVFLRLLLDLFAMTITVVICSLLIEISVR